MRTEAPYLDDIIDAADGIARFISDIEGSTSQRLVTLKIDSRQCYGTICRAQT
jgi:hypothetical protein